MSISQKPPKDQDHFYAPNTLYDKENWVHIPYVRYSRRSTLRQNLAMGGTVAAAILLLVATVLLNSLGIDHDPAVCPLPESTLRILTAVSGFLGAAALVGVILLDRHATKHTWTCTFGRVERWRYISKGKPLYRTRYEHENQRAGIVIAYIFIIAVAVLMVAIAVLNLTGQSLNWTEF